MLKIATACLGAIVLSYLASFQAQAQCCSSGNPFISDAEQPALQSKVLTSSLTYRYSNSSQYYANDSPFNDLPFEQRSYSNYLEFQVGYGVTNWMTVMADLGYFINKTLTTSGEDPYRGYGLGDAELYLKFNAYTNPKARLSISPSFGIKFPIGVFDQEVDNVQLPITVQPSSGSYKYTGNVFISKGISKKMAMAGFLSYEYSQLIESDNFYYKYGDQWIGAIYCNYHIWKGLSLDLQLRNEYRAKSTRENSEIVDASGYDVIFLTPQLTYGFKHNWYLSAYSDIPLYKYYNGVQMSFGYAVSLRVTKKVDFVALKARHDSRKSGNKNQ
jgi:hypothetical protein